MVKLIFLVIAGIAFLTALIASKTSYQTSMAWLVWGNICNTGKWGLTDEIFIPI